MSRHPQVEKLFRSWLSGDAEAGQTMAQTFSDWYYAVSASRLGDQLGRPALEKSCHQFQHGIMSVQRSEDLVSWAHAILEAEVKNCGTRIFQGQHPNALTKNQDPQQLIRQASQYMKLESYETLLSSYGPQGRQRRHSPVETLKARHELKFALKTYLNIEFTEVPKEPRLDLAPLPLYEAGKMTSTQDEAQFERWILNEPSICRDLAEFSSFAIALRSGSLMPVESPPTPAPPSEPAPPSRPPLHMSPPSSSVDAPPLSIPIPESRPVMRYVIGVALVLGLLIALLMELSA